MPSFVKIRIKIWDEYDFGQSSKATQKSFARIPIKLFSDSRFMTLSDSSRFHFILLLISCQNTNESLTISRRSLFESSSKTSHSLILLPLIENQLIEIADDTVTVKRREEKRREEKEKEKTVPPVLRGEFENDSDCRTGLNKPLCGEEILPFTNPKKPVVRELADFVLEEKRRRGLLA